MKTDFTWADYLKAKKITKSQIKKMTEIEYFEYIELMVEWGFQPSIVQATISSNWLELNRLTTKKLQTLERIRKKRYN